MLAELCLIQLQPWQMPCMMLSPHTLYHLWWTWDCKIWLGCHQSGGKFCSFQERATCLVHAELQLCMKEHAQIDCILNFLQNIDWNIPSAGYLTVVWPRHLPGNQSCGLCNSLYTFRKYLSTWSPTNAGYIHLWKLRCMLVSHLLSWQSGLPCMHWHYVALFQCVQTGGGPG